MWSRGILLTEGYVGMAIAGGAAAAAGILFTALLSSRGGRR